MGWRRKKKTEQPEGTKEWDQVLLAEQPKPGEEPAPDLVSEQPPPERVAESASLVEPPESETPAPLEVPDVPEDLEPYVERTETSLVLKQTHFTRAQKRELEHRLSSSSNEFSEAQWIPHRREALRDVEKHVDDLHWRARYKALALGWIKRQDRDRTKTLAGLERVPPHIISKRIVYETAGGFVVEVAHRELGEIRRKHFTVDAKGGRRRALESIKSGNYARVTLLSGPQIELLGPPRGRKSPHGPGKVNTWPITNDKDVREIEGIGDVYARRLHELKIHTTDQLRLHSAEILAGHLGVSPRVVERWQQMAELLGIKGIGKQTAEMLARSGITGIDPVRSSTPKALAGIVNAFAATVEGGARRIAPATARVWIQSARRLKKKAQSFPVSVGAD